MITGELAHWRLPRLYFSLTTAFNETSLELDRNPSPYALPSFDNYLVEIETTQVVVHAYGIAHPHTISFLITQ